ncbi:MAG: extracellular solute-binding protein [Chloroflexi bacterium]|jgi:multiple sugar transport system substrate-binding protein|nr:extracellular solute-binding protein [Chloroflexota bacterium]
MKKTARVRYLYVSMVLTMLLCLVMACGDSTPTTAGTGSTKAGSPAAAAANTPKPTATTLALQVGSTSAKVNLTYMTWGGDSDKTRRFKENQAAYPEFADYSMRLLAQGGDADVASFLRLALTSGKDIPDILQLNRTQLAEFAESGELTDLTSVMEPFKADLTAGALNIATYNGKFFAFPNQVNSKIWYYRADLFEQAGINVNNIKTLADLISAGKTLNAKFPKSYIFNISSQLWASYLPMFLSAYPDIRMANDNGEYQLTKHPGFAEVLKMFKDLKDSGVAAPIDDWSNDWQQAFKDETIVSAFSASWMATFLPTFAPNQSGKWKATLWPSGLTSADQRYGAEGGGSVTVVPKRAPHAKEAIAYLTKNYLNKQTPVKDYQNGGVTPYLKSAQSDVLNFINGATKPADLAEEKWLQRPYVFFGKEFQPLVFQSFDYVKAFNYDPAAAKELEIFSQWARKYINGQVPLNDALAGAQSDMQSQIGNPYQK